MRHKIRRDNRGTSLVEALVSMLILAVIVVPLISSFVVAAKANRKSKEQQYATAAATNIMEAVKEYGLTATARQFNYLEPFSFVYRDASSYMDMTDGLSVTAEGNLLVNTNRKYIYSIKGAEEGSSCFDIRISFSAVNRDGAETVGFMQNQYQFPDFAAFNSEETLMVNPSVTISDYVLKEDGTYELVEGSSFDEKAIEYFYDMHEKYYNSNWLGACSAVAESNQAKLDNYMAEYSAAVSGGTAVPSYPVFDSEPEQTPFVERSEFVKGIKRKLKIVLAEDPSGKVSVNASYVYSYNPDLGYCPYGVADREYSGFCSNIEFDSLDDLKNIYVFYSYFNKNEPEYDSIEVITDDMVFPGDTKIRLFIAVQQDSVITIPLDVSLNSTQFDVYSQGNLGGVYASSSYSRQLYEKLDAKDRLYDVTVEIFDENSEFNPDRLVTSLSSTVKSE